jgi:hypothetical protein
LASSEQGVAISPLFTGNFDEIPPIELFKKRNNKYAALDKDDSVPVFTYKSKHH